MKIPHLRSGLLALVCLAGGYALGRLQDQAQAAAAAQQTVSGGTGRPKPIAARETNTASAPEAATVAVRNQLPAGAEPITADEFLKRMGELSRMPQGMERFRALREVLARALKENPDAVIGWCAASEHAPAMLQGIFETWAQCDPAACAAWLNAHTDAGNRDQMIAGMLQGAAQTSKGVEGAWEWVRAISDPATRADAAIAVSADAWWSDRAGAEREIAALNLPAEMVAAVHKGWEEQAMTAQREAPRNAQNIVSIYNAARASGASIKAGSAEELARALSEGIIVEDKNSPFHGKRFSIGPISGARLAYTLQHVKMDGQEVSYVQDPKQ